MIEKRAFKRLPLQTLLTYDVLDSGGTPNGDGMAKTLDVSNNGLQLELPRKVDRGDRLQLTLGLRDQIVTLFGDVVWACAGSPYGQAGVLVAPDQGDYRQWRDMMPVND